MKKFVSLLLTGCIMAALLTVHAYDTTSGRNAAGAGIVLSLCDRQPETSLIGQAEQQFGQYLQNASGGRISLKYYPSSALGDDISCMQQVKLGALDMCRCDASLLYDWGVESLEQFCRPGAFQSWQQAYEASASDAARQSLQDISAWDDGLVGFGYLADSSSGAFSVCPVVFSAVTWNRLSASDRELISGCWEQALQWYAGQSR